MALPTGTFNSQSSGRLQVVFRGTWSVNETDWGAGAWQLALRAYVGAGADRSTSMMGTDTASATIEVEYEAGTDVPVGLEYVGHNFGGAGTICATDLSISCHLLPPQERPRVVTFAQMLALLSSQMRPMSPAPTTPRWLPDADSGTAWYVRPLSGLATSDATADRFISEDSTAPLTGFCNHPLAGERTPDPIDPDSVVAWGFPSMDWTGEPVAMQTEVLKDLSTIPGTTLYYIRATGGPLIVNPNTGALIGTARISWRYASIALLDGTSTATAWPGLGTVQWSSIGPGDTLWVLGTYEDETLVVGSSGAPGNYIKVRFDYPGDPGRINQGRRLKGPWTQEGNAWWTPMPNTSECMVYEGDIRLSGINTRSRCRSSFTVDPGANTIRFTNIRRVLTGHAIDIASDFVTDKLPAGLSPNTRYYAIVISSTWQFYSVTAATYVIKLAATYADAFAGVAIDLGPRTSEPPPNAFVFVRQYDYPFFDQQQSQLQAGEYAMDVVQQRLYYRPTVGTPGDHVLRLASESYSLIGACVYGAGVSYIRVLGGGEYGGLFGVAPKGRVGMAHQNAIEFTGGSNIVVDGMHIQGARSGVTFINVAFGTSRNNCVLECAHHANGGEGLTGSQEPDLLVERNWISEIGKKHEFGDAQALVTNPHCDRAIFRRNYVQQIGENKKVNNPTAAVFDGSANISCYLNWFDNCHGKVAELGAGAAEPIVIGAVVFGNVVTRHGQGLARDENLVQIVAAFNQSLNGGDTDPGVTGTRIIGNLVAWTTIGNRAPDTLEETGLVCQRNMRNPSGLGSNDLAFERNAILSCDGPVWSRRKNAVALRWPEFTADENLYATVPEWAVTSSDGVILQEWTGAQIVGASPGYWTFDTGQDTLSEFAVHHPADKARGPILNELDFIRRFDAYDTYEQPDTDIVSGFPFAPIATP